MKSTYKNRLKINITRGIVLLKKNFVSILHRVKDIIPLERNQKQIQKPDTSFSPLLVVLLICFSAYNPNI